MSESWNLGGWLATTKTYIPYVVCLDAADYRNEVDLARTVRLIWQHGHGVMIYHGHQIWRPVERQRRFLWWRWTEIVCELEGRGDE